MEVLQDDQINTVGSDGKRGRLKLKQDASVLTRFGLGYSAAAYAGFTLFSLIISLGFFLEGTQASFSALSGDQLNILTVCVKKDRPELLAGDLVAGDVNNVKYYIPAFVNLIRFASLPDHNYLRGLNILLFITSMLYMWGWWLLFSVWGDKWIAAILAFLVRGIMWPPGNELWGIAGLWTMLPRTLFLALIPWVLWWWFRGRRSQKCWLWTCLACGLIANIHPISGLCLTLALLAAEFSWEMLESKGWLMALRQVFLGGIVAVIGLSPFIWTYLSVLADMKSVETSEFHEAVHMRLNPILFNPWSYVSRWGDAKWVVLIVLPWVIWYFISRRRSLKDRKVVLSLGAFALTCIVAVLLPFLAEAVLNRMGFNALFAFQLVRNGKYILIPSILVWSLLCVLACQWLERVTRKGQAIKIILCCLIVMLTVFSRNTIFDRVPLLGDDVTRFLWPSWSASRLLVTPERQIASELKMNDALAWIKANTPEDAKFVGPRSIRAGALRSVIHDFGGAVMLIEGNPRAFVEAARREEQMREPEYTDTVERSKLVASWGADYWVIKTYDPRLHLAYAGDGWFIYELDSPRQLAGKPRQ